MPKQPAQVNTIASLLASTPFYIAHRGSGDNWVEHSLDAYSHSVALGTKALEISVSATSDGKLVCHHDTSTGRLSSSNVEISSVTYAQLVSVKNDARAWLGPKAAPQPIPLLSDVLDRFAATQVIFIEDKQGTNTQALLKAMGRYPSSRSHFVWKQWAGGHQDVVVSAQGYKTWGYFTPELYASAAVLAKRFDYLGVFHTDTDTNIAALVSLGKPVIGWEIHYRAVRDRMSRLGVVGMMCSNLPYVTSKGPSATVDSFGSGRRAAGDLPWTVDQGYSVQPLLNADVASVSLDHSGVQSYLLGSLSPIAKPPYRVEYETRWPTALPPSGQHAGIAFACADDLPYRVGIAGETAGLHVILRANGSLELFSRPAGTATGTRVASVQTDRPKAGQWMRFSLEVSVGSVRVRRLDGPGWATEAALAATGGYLWLCKNYPEANAVEFRHVSVTA